MVEILNNEPILSDREATIVKALREKGLVPLLSALDIPLCQTSEVFLPEGLDVCAVFVDQKNKNIPFHPDIGIVSEPGTLGIGKVSHSGNLQQAHKHPPRFGEHRSGRFVDISLTSQKRRRAYVIAPHLLMVNNTLGKIGNVLERSMK